MGFGGVSASSFVVGLAVFVALVSLIPIGLALAPLIVGLPVLATTVSIWIGVARFSAGGSQSFFGEKILNPTRRPTETSYLRRAWVLMKDGSVWKDLVYDLLLFPIGIAELVIAILAVSLPVAFLGTGLFYWVGDGVFLIGDSNTNTGWHIDTIWEGAALTAFGVVLLGLGLFAIGATADLHVIVAKWILGRSHTEELEERVDVLTKTRSDVMEAMMLERRRIERDLHDGAQQHLVSLAMTLGMAKEKMASDPDAARELVASSHEEAKQVLTELRSLVRGIHPAVLTDRGLDAAISAIAGRCPVPVMVDVDVADRPPETIESTGYFIVAEALTNVAKHSQAKAAQVSIRRDGDLLRIIVRDDGTGGATLSPNNGLGGLADRVAALDGRFSVSSPEGGGTAIEAEIPCGS